MISVYLPAALRPHAGGAEVLTITAAVRSMAELLEAVARRAPRLLRQLDDSMYTFAINDEMLLCRLDAHPLRDGDRVQIVPAIAGR